MYRNDCPVGRHERERERNKPTPMSKMKARFLLNKSGLLGNIVPQVLVLCCGTLDFTTRKYTVTNAKLILLLNRTLSPPIGEKYTGTKPKDMF